MSGDGRADLEFVRSVVLYQVRAHRIPIRFLDDLIGAGALAAVGARKRYSDSHGTSFEQYATPRIRGAVIDELRKFDLLPRGLRQEYQAREETFTPTISLDLFDLDFRSDDHSPELLVVAKGEAERLQRAIDELPDRYRTVVTDALAGDKFTVIADKFGVTQSRISQLHKEAGALLAVLLNRQSSPPTPRGAIGMTNNQIPVLLSRARSSVDDRTRKLATQLDALIQELEARLYAEENAAQTKREIEELEWKLAEARAKLPKTGRNRASAGSRAKNGVCPDCNKTGLGNVGVHRSKAHGYRRPDKASA